MSGIKPPYKVPSMKEIEEIPWNGYNVVSTFSGGGGSCLGYRMAGYHVLWANEFVEEAQKTYRANHPHTILDCNDIRTITAGDILNAIHKKPGEIDLFDGSPPCCAFSTAGKREKGWGQARSYSDGKKQQIENLFFEYIRILDGLKPKTFIAENVSGLVKGTGLGYFKEFLREMKKCGYRVKAQLLNSKWLGVPQSRERIIFMGVREDLGLEPVYPKPEPYFYTIRDAIDDIQNDPEEIKYLFESMQRHKIAKIVAQMPKNPYKTVSGQDITGHGYFSLVRNPYDSPVSTIQQAQGASGTAGTIHPFEDRKFSIPELKRLMSVPDDFILTGEFPKQWERLGRMVPPVMMKHIAETIQKEVLDKCKIT